MALKFILPMAIMALMVSAMPQGNGTDLGESQEQSDDNSGGPSSLCPPDVENCADKLRLCNEIINSRSSEEEVISEEKYREGRKVCEKKYGTDDKKESTDPDTLSDVDVCVYKRIGVFTKEGKVNKPFLKDIFIRLTVDAPEEVRTAIVNATDTCPDTSVPGYAECVFHSCLRVV